MTMINTKRERESLSRFQRQRKLYFHCGGGWGAVVWDNKGSFMEETGFHHSKLQWGQWTKSKRKQHSQYFCSCWFDMLRMVIVVWFLSFFFKHRPFLKSSLNLLQYCFCFIFCFLAMKHVVSWNSPPGTELTPSALES